MSRQHMTSSPTKTVNREYVTTAPTTTGYVVRPHVTHVVEPRVTYVQEARTHIEYVPQVTYVAQERTTYETVPRTEYESKSYTTYDVQPIREQQTVMVEQEVPVYYQGATEQTVYGQTQYATCAYQAPAASCCINTSACCTTNYLPSCHSPVNGVSTALQMYGCVDGSYRMSRRPIQRYASQQYYTQGSACSPRSGGAMYRNGVYYA